MGEQYDINLYRYVYNSPLNYVDPNGLWGIQFGDFNIGWGDPNLAFDSDSWNDLGQGAAATADGFIPFFDPFEDLFDIYDSDCDKTLQISQALGGFSRDLLTWAAGGAAGTALRAQGTSMTAAQRFALGEFGPSWTSVLGSGNISGASLAADYAGKIAGRVDTALQLFDVY